MRRAWFCYEAGSSGPVPVIHYDSLPNAKNYLNPKILQSFQLERKWFLDCGDGGEKDEVTSSFNILQQYFPYFGNEYITEKTFSLDSKEAAE